MKPIEQARSRDLRRSGWSIKQIASHLSVSPSSVHRWVLDIELRPEQTAALNRRGHTGRERFRKTWIAKHRAQRAEYQVVGRLNALQGDALHLAGCMLMWAEGSKERNAVKFANSDPDMMELFVDFLRECYRVPDEAMTLRIYCYLNNGLTLDEIEDFWLATLGLPPSCLRSGNVDRPPTSSGVMKRNLPYGTAHLAVFRTDLAQTIYGAIQAYGGFHRPEWLD